MNFKYKRVAVGGTFDHFHIGHKALLRTTFESGESVMIGVSSDGFAKKLGKGLDQKFDVRVERLKNFLNSSFPNRRYEINSLEDHFGPVIIDRDIDAIVVSEETLSKAKEANELRKAKRLKPLKIILIDTVLADDGLPVSSTRIRNKEIDEEGHKIKQKA
ncbi:MAG: pantetheine-phosphate adenylyltransferase [archaeon]|nr:pantetheine-phosphate adenylyltransferase [archaeon]MCP8314171.1 pantetheine-phosphate adenylyltransferase [archaeon]